MKIGLRYTALAMVTACSFAYACSAGENNEDTSSSSGDPTTTTTGSGGAGGEGAGTNDGGSSTSLMTTNGPGGMGGQGGDCAAVELESEQTLKPTDVIFVIDNSGSMSEEIDSVELNIDQNFTNIITASQVDWKVVMVTNHGNSLYDVCIGPPLSGTTDCTQQPVEIPGQFRHYSVDVQSHDSLCIILDTFYGSNAGGEADEYGAHPNGWGQFLRQEAVKAFVEISDDGIVCTHNGNTYDDNDNDPDGKQVAIDWDKDLLALAPFQFGSVAQRNYLFYSIVGLAQNNPATDPWEWFDPIQTSTCGSGCVAPGTGYQYLSKGTQALRFPVSQYASYDAVFNGIAAGIIEGVQLPCEIDVEPPMNGQMLDWNTVDVEYTPGDMMSPTETFVDVGAEAACGASTNGYYVDTVENKVFLCPLTCNRLEGDLGAEIGVFLQCGGIAE